MPITFNMKFDGAVTQKIAHTVQNKINKANTRDYYVDVGNLLINNAATNFQKGGIDAKTGASRAWAKNSELTKKVKRIEGHTRIMQRTGAAKKYQYRANDTGVIAFPIVPYMKYLHSGSDGWDLTITDKMRKFFWAKYFETGLVEFMYMALTKKKTFHIKLPARPIEMWLPDTARQVTRIYLQHLRKALRQP